VIDLQGKLKIKGDIIMTKLSKKLLMSVLAITITTGSFIGCGSKEAGEEITKAEVAVETTEDNKYGGVIKAIDEAGPVTLFLPSSSTTGDRYYTAPAAEPLGRLQLDGTTKPFLAEEFITDPENLTFTIKVRPDVYFHDGSICDAEAIKWNLEQMVEQGKASELGNPVSVEAPDSSTVVVKYDTWSNNWDTVIGEVAIISKEAFEKNGQEWCEVNIVGTGPFVFDSYVQDSSLKFKKNENYRIEGQPYLDSFEFVIVPDLNTRITAFLNGEVDTIRAMDAVVINNLKQAGFENVAAESANLAEIKHVIFNSKDKEKPLGNLKVRQAVMHAMDWENLAKSLSGGIGSPSPLFATPDSWAYNPEATYYEYDLEKSKALLAEAGYPDGFSTIINTTSSFNDIAVALQASLSKIGITAEVKTWDKSALAEVQVKDNVEGFIVNRGGSQMDFTKNYIRLYSPEGIKNHGIMEFTQEYQDALFGARAAKTVDEKKVLLQKAAKVLVQDNAMIYPVSVIYTQCFEQKDIRDLGFYQASAYQYTPEAAYRAK
jgi:ABC-type transport system substrate-binding protein